jgi:hypothetical protein
MMRASAASASCARAKAGRSADHARPFQWFLRRSDREEATLSLPAGALRYCPERRFDPGTLLIIELSAKAKGRVRALGVRVIHAILETQTCWIFACNFVTPLNEEELQSLVAE